MKFFNKEKTEKGLKLSEEQLEKCFQAGERFSKKMKLHERISKINKFGNENPQRMFLYIFIGLFMVFFIGFLIPIPKISTSSIPTVSTSVVKEPKVDKLEIELSNIYDELKTVSDTLAKALEKPNKTIEDSIFIMNTYERFEQLQNMVNKKYGNE